MSIMRVLVAALRNSPSGKDAAEPADNLDTGPLRQSDVEELLADTIYAQTISGDDQPAPRLRHRPSGDLASADRSAP